MSSGADCQFKEVEPGRYIYRLQRWPYGDTEEYDQYGPFAPFSTALAHLDRNHQNPGGWSVKTLPEGQHQHDWESGDVCIPVGVQVTIRIESLGPDPSPAEVLALLRTKVTEDHLRITKVYGFKQGVRCAACGVEKEGIR